MTRIMFFSYGYARQIIRQFPYYSYSRKPTGREFLVPARTLTVIFLLIENYKVNEKKKIYHLSVNYNNRSPAVGNDSQNSINCHRRDAIIYELTNNIYTNNSVARLYNDQNYVFQLRLCTTNNQQQKKMQVIRWLFRWPCGSGGAVPSASPSTAGLGLPQMPLDAAIRRVPSHPVSPQQMPWSLISA